MTVIFQSHTQLELWDRFLRSLTEDGRESLLVATSSQEVSLASLKLVQLFSPLVRNIVEDLPPTAAGSPLTIILPDTDADSWKCLMGLLTDGSVDVCLPSCNKSNVECLKKEISSLARCLQINLGSEQVFEEAQTKLKVKRLEELLEEESTFSIVSNQEKNIVNNDYDSDQEDVLVPLNPDANQEKNLANDNESELEDVLVPLNRELDNCDSSNGSSPSSVVPASPEKMIKVPGLKEKRKIILTWTSNPCLDETMTEGEEVSSTAPSDSNSKAINDNICESSEVALPLPLYNELDEDIRAEGDQSHDSAFESCVVRDKLVFWRKNPTLTRAIFEEQIDCTIDTCFGETRTTTEEEVVMSNAPSCSDSNSNLIKGRDFEHTPPKVAKLTYAAWKAKREELKREQRYTEAIVVKGGNNVVENINSWSAQQKCKIQNDLKEICPRCDKEFKTKEGLFHHFNATHCKNVKPYEFECVECPRPRVGFVKKTLLNDHLSKSHKLRIKQGYYIIDREKATFEYETERKLSVTDAKSLKTLKIKGFRK